MPSHTLQVPNGPVRTCGEQVPPWPEVIAEAAERREEALGGGDRLEPPHDVLPHARGLMRLLHAVVQPGRRTDPQVLDRREFG